MKKSRFGLGAVLVLLGSAAPGRADDTLKNYQQALRTQGFYYGAIDGALNDATTEAVRRYQIRNGLKVTGTLDDETRRTIDHDGESAKATPPPLVEPTPTPAPRASAPPRSTPRAAAPPEIADDGRNPPAGPPSNARERDDSQHIAPSAGLTNYFGGTPFELAPPPVQAGTIRRAQVILSRSGFYDGQADGRPSHELAEAVSNYQEVRHLRRSGRLDNDTLAALRLTPGRRNPPPSRDYRETDRRSEGGVYNGRIVR